MHIFLIISREPFIRMLCSLLSSHPVHIWRSPQQNHHNHCHIECHNHHHYYYYYHHHPRYHPFCFCNSDLFIYKFVLIF